MPRPCAVVVHVGFWGEQIRNHRELPRHKAVALKCWPIAHGHIVWSLVIRHSRMTNDQLDVDAEVAEGVAQAGDLLAKFLQLALERLAVAVELALGRGQLFLKALLLGG